MEVYAQSQKPSSWGLIFKYIFETVKNITPYQWMRIAGILGFGSYYFYPNISQMVTGKYIAAVSSQTEAVSALTTVNSSVIATEVVAGASTTAGALVINANTEILQRNLLKLATAVKTLLSLLVTHFTHDTRPMNVTFLTLCLSTVTVIWRELSPTTELPIVPNIPSSVIVSNGNTTTNPFSVISNNNNTTICPFSGEGIPLSPGVQNESPRVPGTRPLNNILENQKNEEE